MTHKGKEVISMQIIPAKKVVVCKQPENVTKSGLKLAGEEGRDKKEPEIGVVVELGEGKTPVPVKKGDTIVFRRYSENRIAIKGEKFNFIDFKDIMAVVKD